MNADILEIILFSPVSNFKCMQICKEEGLPKLLEVLTITKSYGFQICTKNGSFSRRFFLGFPVNSDEGKELFSSIPEDRKKAATAFCEANKYERIIILSNVPHPDCIKLNPYDQCIPKWDELTNQLNFENIH